MRSTKTITSLREALAVQPKEVVSLVGAGGKTTLMFALARELSSDRGLVITTTTTKIFPPSSTDSPCLLVSREEEEVVAFIFENERKARHVTIASEFLADSGKLQGISPFLVIKLIGLNPVQYVIVEADGAARRPLKAPDQDFEPVIPECTSLVIPIVGLDAVGCELSERNVFRSGIASKLTGLPLGATVTTEVIADLVLHPSGIIHGSPDEARIIPFINKMDLYADPSAARRLACQILDRGHPRMDRVVLGQARFHPPAVEVIFQG